MNVSVKKIVIKKKEYDVAFLSIFPLLLVKNHVELVKYNVFNILLIEKIFKHELIVNSYIYIYITIN